MRWLRGDGMLTLALAIAITYLISWLVAVYGCGRIPPSVRYAEVV